jgi:hypothetical protein
MSAMSIDSPGAKVSGGWHLDFFLFVLVTALLFIRPNDFVPILDVVPVYAITITGCILVSMNTILSQFSGPSLRKRPILVFMFGLLIIATFSDLIRGRVEDALYFSIDYIKVIIFFMLLIGLVNSSARLELYLRCLVPIFLIPICLSVLQYHGVVNISAFAPINSDVQFDPVTGEDLLVPRLRGSGAFQDPNDVCEIINAPIFICLYKLLDRRSRSARFSWLAPLIVFGYALSLTHSRGGLLGLMAGLAALFWSRFGLRKSILLTAVCLPAILYLFAGRMTSFSTSEGTGNGRIQIWEDAFVLMRHSPFFGIGTGQLVNEIGHVAHNSFVNTYTEQGFLGGSLYFGCYLYALATLARLGSPSITIHDPEIKQLRPFILAMLVSYTVSEMSVTHPFNVVTYAILGLASAVILVADPQSPVSGLEFDGRLVWRVFRASAFFLIALIAFMKYTVR